MRKTGVLLLNLGTPASPGLWDVFRYLSEFLTDDRVIDLPWFQRQCLVRLGIIPRRLRASTQLYRRIWTAQGSPLLVHSRSVQDKLQRALGDSFVVATGMRYQQPSIEQALRELQHSHLARIIAIPMFPQYASATTGSVHQKVMECVSRWAVIPEMHFVNSYPTQPQLIQAFAMQARQLDLDSYDHLLFSFHGLPESQLRKSNPRGRCLSDPGCCAEITAFNACCYRAQCYATADALVRELGIPSDGYTICFQSRLGKDPWTQPYTEDLIRKLAKTGCRRLLVFAPAFTCDCLETLDEVGREYAHQFHLEGGEHLQLVPSVNDHPVWVEGLREMILAAPAETLYPGVRCP